jgi:hypothetical protein
MSPILVPAPPRSIQWAASLQPGSYGFSSSKQSTGAGANEEMILTPVYFHRSVTIDRLGCEVTTAGNAGSVGRLGVYADNGNLYPGTLLLDAGTVAADSTGIKEVTVSLVIPVGVVWVGLAVQAATSSVPTWRIVSGSPPLGDDVNTAVNATDNGYGQSSVSGALPSTFTTTMTRTSVARRIFWRIAA